MKKPRVALVTSPTNRSLVRDMAGGFGFRGGYANLPPLDLLYWGATLGQTSEVCLIDGLGASLHDEPFLARLHSAAPDVIILSVGLPSLYSDLDVIRKVRDAFSASHIVIKTSITEPILLKTILKQAEPCLCVVGECDLTIADIIFNGFKPGTAEMIEGNVVSHPEVLERNLDYLPMPARHLLDSELYYYNLLDRPMTIMQTSRGCPYGCGYYCPYPLVQGKTWRYRSAEHILSEIEDIVSHYHVSNILFRDAVFTLGRKRVEELCLGILDRDLKVSWWCETRIDCLDSELLKIMKRAGCQGINIGVETGNPALFTERAKPGVNIHKLEELQLLADVNKIKLQYLLLLGLPGESRASIVDTFRLVCRLKPYSIGISLVTPYPGTQLYKDAVDQGWIEDTRWESFDTDHAVMSTPMVSTRDLLYARDAMYKGFQLAINASSAKSDELSKLYKQLDGWATSEVSSSNEATR